MGIDTQKERDQASIRGAIDVMERKQLRPLRELALGAAGALARVQAIDTEIAALRAQLES